MNIRDKVAEIRAWHEAVAMTHTGAEPLTRRQAEAAHQHRATLLTIVKAALDVVEAAKPCAEREVFAADKETLYAALAAFREVAGND